MEEHEEYQQEVGREFEHLRLELSSQRDSEDGQENVSISQIGGGGSLQSPWRMKFGLNGSGAPVVTFSVSSAEVYIKGTNSFLYTGGDGTGRPQNVDDEIALTSGSVNYIYIEASWDDSTSVEPDGFEVIVYTSEQDITEIETDTSPTPDVEYQSKARTLIGFLEVDSSDALTGSSQSVNTQLFAELFDVSSATVYLLTP